MPWRGHLSNFCKICGEPRLEGEYLTKRGNHSTCSAAIADAEIKQLRNHTGPHFEHWRRQMAASVGGILLDDVSETD